MKGEENVITAIVLASGSGVRFGSTVPKQFLRLAGKPILQHALDVFDSHDQIDCIVIVSHPDWMEQCRAHAAHLRKAADVVSGGKTRMDSSFAGITASPPGTTHVLIHDAVRPLLTPSIISSVIAAFERHRAVGTVIDSTDTVVKVRDNMIEEIPERSALRRIQTPQGFELGTIRSAHGQAREAGLTASTDDCGLVLRLGLPVRTVPGSRDNLKITDQLDLAVAESYLRARTLHPERK
jgi:2-C-methyl-D-erythritol 4-phosphate cytidylyltransferase